MYLKSVQFLFSQKNILKRRKLPILSYSLDEFIENQNFEKCIILPIHYSIGNKEFTNSLESLKKIK